MLCGWVSRYRLMPAIETVHISLATVERPNVELSITKGQGRAAKLLGAVTFVTSHGWARIENGNRQLPWVGWTKSNKAVTIFGVPVRRESKKAFDY